MSYYLAQNLNFNFGRGPSGGSGSMISINGPLVNIDNLTDLLNVVMSFVYPFASVILFAAILWGGYDFLMSGGDADKVNSGKAKMTAGIVGFVLLALSYLISQVIGFIFGVGNGIL